MKRKRKPTTRAGRNEAARKTEESDGPFVLVNVAVTAALLALHQPTTLGRKIADAWAAETGEKGGIVDLKARAMRTFVARLRSGQRPRTRLYALRRLAMELGVPIADLTVSDGGAVTAGAYIPSTRARVVAETWAKVYGSAQEELPWDIKPTFEAILSYDRWTNALSATGKPMLRDRGPILKNLEKLEDRRIRFANALADALLILSEPFTSQRARSTLDRHHASLLLARLADIVHATRIAERLGQARQPLISRKALAAEVANLLATRKRPLSS